MPNPWIQHVKKYAAENGISYACAVSKASASYHKQKETPKPEPIRATDSYDVAMAKDAAERKQRAAARLEKQKKEIMQREKEYRRQNRNS